MRLGIDVSQHQLSWEELLSRVTWAEDRGFGGAWVFDHFTALYGNPNGPCLDGWSLLASLAAATERIRLGSLVTGITYRHPSMLATQAVTVDHVSRGRLDLALGAAWHQTEHEELGIDFPPTGERVTRLEEGVQVIKALMTRDDISFSGRHYRLRNASYNPKPVQRPHPPLWIGGGGRRVLGIAGRHADVWHSFGSIAELSRKSAVVDDAARAAGRSPDDIERAASLSISEDWDEVATRTEGLRDAGFGYLVVSWPAGGRDRVAEFMDRIGAALIS